MPSLVMGFNYMKKFSIRFSCIIFIFIFAFVSIPFQSVNANTSWDNIIYAIKSNLGMVKVADGSLSALDNNDFYLSLYETTLAWNNVSFVPANTFNNKAHWVQCCNSRGVPDVVGFTDFDIVSCLEQSGYISRRDGGYDFSNISNLGDNFQNTQSPLDGVKVISHFNYDGEFSSLGIPSYSETLISNIKNDFISQYDNVYLFSGLQTYTNKPYQYMYRFYSFPNSDYVYFIESKNSSNEIGIYYNFHNISSNSWNGGYDCSCVYLPFGSGITSKDYLRYPTPSNTWVNVINSFPYVSSDNTNVQNNNSLSIRFYQNIIPNYWSNYPIVLASNDSAGQNYYYWLHSTPSGSFYTTSNTGNVYTTDYIENNDWIQIYNNYVTDVSNYYSTTENITNENLTQYIDNSTTITNITNNYITNNNGGGGEDDIITNSWLERIYNLLLDFYFAFIGQPSSGSGDNNTFYTDNSVKNDIVNYPLSEFFPDVPSEYFIPEDETFSIPLFNQKTARVLQTAMPFCYLEKLKYIASFLSTPPQTPHYEIPFVIDSFGIDETVSISFEHNAWGVLHSVWIALFMIIFVIALFYFTYRFILLVSSILG